jgi:3-oxoadipate enol-lactonase
MQGEHAVEVRGVRLAYELRGEGLPLVWGHGLTSSRARDDDLRPLDWDKLAQATQLLRYDARGHGRSGTSTVPADSSWSSLARDQLALADALGIDRYVTGGASMGCGTALHAAVLAPERVQALLLVIPPTAWATRRARAQVWDELATKVETAGGQAFLDVMADEPPGPFRGTTRWEDASARSVLGQEPSRLASALRGAATADLPDPTELRAIVAPTLVLAWTGDPVHPLDTAERLVELIGGAELVVADTAEELETWTDRALAFLASV